MKIKNKLLISLLAVVLIFSFIYRPRNAEAVSIGSVLGGGAGTALHCSNVLDDVSGFLGGLFGGGKKAAAAGPVPVDDKKDNNKEGCLDSIAFMAINILLEETIKETTRWVNGETGDGGPKYLTNLDGFLLDIGDRTVADYIHGTDFGFVCDPFKLQLKISLAKAHSPRQPRAQCTLSDIVQNVKGFVGGNFYDGGWDAWGEVVTRSNPYLNYLQAENELQLKLKANKDRELADISAGGGFLSIKQCPGEVYQCNIGGAIHNVSKEECEAGELISTSDNDLWGGVPVGVGVWECAQPEKIVTPGSVINEQLNNVLDSGKRRLEVADEINELVSSLLSKLLNDLFSDKGLAGYDPSARTDTKTELENGYSPCETYGVCNPGDTPEDICAFWDIPADECVPGTTVEVCVDRPGFSDDDREDIQNGQGNFSTSNANTDNSRSDQICTLVEIPGPNDESQSRECSDGIDNDGDGKIDLQDFGCRNVVDNTENTDAGNVDPPTCSDGKDNDGDGLIDFGEDPGCLGAGDHGEKDDGSDDENEDENEGGGGSTSFTGDDPSPEAPKNLNNVVWASNSANVSAWKVTSKLNEGGISINEEQICLDHSKKGLWPNVGGVEGNPWIFASIGGKWHAGTYEWLRPGQVCKALEANPPFSTVREGIGPHVKVSPLGTWKPRKGELVGFMVSALSRLDSRSVEERSNVVFIKWPF